MVIFGLSVNLSTLYLGRLGPPMLLTSTQCPTYNCPSEENDLRKDFMIIQNLQVCDRTEPGTSDFCQTHYRLHYATQLRILMDSETLYSSYRKNSKNWDTLNYYRNCPTNGIVGF